MALSAGKHVSATEPCDVRAHDRFVLGLVDMHSSLLADAAAYLKCQPGTMVALRPPIWQASRSELRGRV